MVSMKASRASSSPSEAKPRATSSRSVPACKRSRPISRPTTSPAASTRGCMSQGMHPLRPGQGRGAQQRMDLAPKPTRRDEHEALAPLGELVGELHRDPAAERVAHNRRAVVPEGDHRVAHGARVGAERVVAPRLGGLAVAQQVGREDLVIAGQVVDRGLPLVRAARDPVDEHHERPLAGGAEADAVTVKREFVER